MMTMRVLFVLLACLELVACSGSPPKDPNERSATELYMLKGVQYMEHGRLDVAQQDLQHAVELDDHNVEAHNALGVLYGRLGQPQAAEEHFKRALSLDENNLSVANNYGRMLCAQGKSEQAMKLFRSAFESRLYATPWLALTNAGICAINTGAKADGEAYLRKALDANPSFAPALLEMAKLSQANGAHLSARGFLQRFESAAEPTPESLLIGVQTEQALGNFNDADQYLDKLQRLFPDSKEALGSRKSHAAH